MTSYYRMTCGNESCKNEFVLSFRFPRCNDFAVSEDLVWFGHRILESLSPPDDSQNEESFYEQRESFMDALHEWARCKTDDSNLQQLLTEVCTFADICKYGVNTPFTEYRDLLATHPERDI